MAPIPLVSRFTHPFLFFVFSPFKPRTFIKKVSSQELRGWRPNTGMKMGQEVRGGEAQDRRGNWRKKFFTACGTRQPSRTSVVLIPPFWLSTIFTLSLLIPTHSRYKAATPSRMLRLTFYTTAGLVALEIIMPALSATPPPRWKDLRGWDPYNGADKVTTNISALYNLVHLRAFFMSDIQGFSSQEETYGYLEMDRFINV